MAFTSGRDVYSDPEDTRGTWRVHVAAPGFNELDRLVEPLELLTADAFYLLKQPEDDRALEHYSDAGVDLISRIKDLSLRDVGVWEVNLWDAATVGGFLGQKMVEEGFDSLHVNVSTGPKTVGIGATLASLFWEIELYYANLDYDAEEQDGVRGYPFESIQRVPTFHTEPPRPAILSALDIMAGQEEPLRAKDLKPLFQKGDDPPIQPESGDPGDMSAQAVHGQFQRLMRPLIEQHLVKVQRQYGKKHYEITTQGHATLRLLREAASKQS